MTMPNDPAPRITDPWKGNDGRMWRTVRYWVGTGYTAGFLQYQRPDGSWMGY